MGFTRLNLSLVRSARDEGGVAAVEFSLLAPILFFCCLATVDVGLAVGERMTIDHVLRAGANFAMQDPGEAAVKDALVSIAKKNFSGAQVAPGDGEGVSNSAETLYFEVDKFFACDDTPATPEAEPSSCTGDFYTFYRLNATKTYAAMILPNISFNPVIQVQVR